MGQRWELAGSKDPQNRSKKDCFCGGHNAKNVKKNKHHHATKMKLLYRLDKIKAKQVV